MSRLPIPGSDDGQWGTILNDFLGVEHNSDGTLKSSGTIASKANDSTVVHNTGNESITGVKTFTSSPIVPTPTTSTQASSKGYVDSVAGGVPASTVVTETTYGQSSSVGVATNYAREDHTHGSPALASVAPATTEGIGTAAALGVAATPARADHVHPMAAAGAPAASAVGNSQVTGVAATFAASDHVHAREAFGNVTALSAFNTTSTNGAATTVAHSDHVHGAPALATYSTALSSDQTNSTTTMTDITGMGLSVGIGNYEFDFLIPYTSSIAGTATNNISVQLNGPTASLIAYTSEFQTAFSTNYFVWKTAFASPNASTQNLQTAGTVYVCRMRGRVTTTALGTLQPQFAVNTGGTATITVKAGAYSKLIPIA